MTNAPQEYDLARIRKLLSRAFTAPELRRFCQDRPVFSPVLEWFGPSQSFADWVDALIDYCQTNMLFPELLEEVRKVKPRRFAAHEPYIWQKETSIPPPRGNQFRAKVAIGALAVLLTVTIGLLIYLAATGGGGTVTPSPEPTMSVPSEAPPEEQTTDTSTPTSKPTPTPTLTSTSTATATPSSTSTPAATPTSTSTPTPGLPFYEHFDAGLGQWIGADWTDRWEIVTDGDRDHVLCLISADSFIFAGSDTWKDYVLQLDLKIRESQPGNAAYVRFRASPPEPAYEALFHTSGVGLERISAGRETDRFLAGKGMDLEEDQWYAITIQAIGDLIQVTVDEARVLQVRDEGEPDYLEQGWIGLGVAPGADVCYDNVRVLPVP
jgi:hypothetical protein